MSASLLLAASLFLFPAPPQQDAKELAQSLLTQALARQENYDWYGGELRADYKATPNLTASANAPQPSPHNSRPPHSIL